MKTPTREQQLEWVKTYKAAAIELEEQRWRELQALTDEEALRISDMLLSIPVPDRWRESSGLVEQQALFQKLRRS